ncbi:MAG: M28 family peptidase [Acidobacteria bacterium]|nr:M28 family peptidase [Acidobacteriota bacterium]
MSRRATCWTVGALSALLAGAAGATIRVGVAAPSEATTGRGPEAPRVSRRLAAKIRAGVKALADDSMEGRGLGSEGIRRAASWIESRLRDIGLEPAFGPSYRQPFQVKVGVELAPGNRLEGVADGDWMPLGFSSPGEFSAELAFAGYGIESPEIGFQELAGLDLRGKVVLMLRYEPQERDEASPFNGKRPSRWSALRYKALQARERGAAAVIFVTGPLQDEGKDKIPALKNDGPESPAGIPALQVTTSVAQKWLDGIGVDLKAFQEIVDRDLAPRSVAATGIRVTGRVALNPVYAQTENLAGVIPGRGALAGECVVVGAHYDHLGMGGEGSMRPNVTAVHNGADDNASGVVAALVIAEELRRSLANEESHRTGIVALFSGEEVGLAGSSHFVKDPPFPLGRAVAMINLDMVGRLRDDTLIALGTESAPEWADAIARAARAVPGLKVTGRGDGYGPSDQTSFYASGIPVLHLFTGAHEAYHTPDDDAEAVDAEGAARIARFSVALARDLARGPDRPTYARSTAGPSMVGDSRGYGAYLGSVPDYRAMESTEGAVLLADVRKNGPADRAGIHGGDRIVEMAGTRIENLYDMTYALQDHRPGETIEVAVIREGQRLALRATLGDRAAMQGGGPGTDPAAGPSPAAAHGPTSTTGPETAPATVASEASGQGAAPGGTRPATAIAPFYERRPGPEFRVEAGLPFPGSFPGERHLADLRQLTFGGENAEAYFSPDGRRLIFQATTPGAGCDQEYVMDLATGETTRVSTGRGRTTCGYFDWPEADRIIYASTHGSGEGCPPPPDHSRGYVWALYDSYDIYEARPDGSDVRRLTETPGYDAEATWCHRGGRLVFTSARDGDLDLYVMDEAGSARRLTNEPGYDGGAVFSPDCSEIAWRASRHQGGDLEEYRRLLKDGLVRPHVLEIYIMKADGTGRRQITSNGAANFCPTFTADGSRIIYASNAGSRGGREFDLWLVDKAGGEPERITFAPGFDGFPHFSPDGRWIVWASNRADPASRETNLFIARWAE